MQRHKTMPRGSRGEEGDLRGEVQKLRAQLQKSKDWEAIAIRILEELNEAVEYFGSEIEYELFDFKKKRPCEFANGDDEEEEEEGEEENGEGEEE